MIASPAYLPAPPVLSVNLREPSLKLEPHAAESGNFITRIMTTFVPKFAVQ